MQVFLGILVNILLFFLLLTVLIGAHELGHLLAAKIAKIPVERFSIGFGRAIFKWKMGETMYQFAWIPLGGYVKFKGEDFDDPEGFFSFPFGRKVFTSFAGIVFNYLLAIFVYFIIGLGWGVKVPPPIIDFPADSPLHQAGFEPGDRVVAVDGKEIRYFSEFTGLLPNRDTLKVAVIRSGTLKTVTLPPSNPSQIDYLVDPVIDRVFPETPAALAGLKSGDRIIEIEGKPIQNWKELSQIVSGLDSARALEFVWIRNKDTLKASITPKRFEGEEGLAVGITAALPSRPLSFTQALWLPLVKTGEVTAEIVVTVAKIIVGKAPAKALGGPVRIYEFTAQTRKLGFDTFLGLLAALSISLGIINLVPIPVLDGGRITMFAVEKVAGRRLGKKAWTIASYIGIVLVIALIVLVFYNDLADKVVRLFGGR